MTKQKQRIAIAEACGWTFTKYPDNTIWPTNPKGKFGIDTAGNTIEYPNYLHDLNAMHEAENIFWEVDSTEDLWNVYTMHLNKICKRDSNCSIRATATQRAEAFLRTIGKWKD